MADRVREAAGPGRTDVALLPINGQVPERRVAGNLWGDEAATVAHDIGARLAIPMHFEMFAFKQRAARRVRPRPAPASASRTACCGRASG